MAATRRPREDCALKSPAWATDFYSLLRIVEFQLGVSKEETVTEDNRETTEKTTEKTTKEENVKN